MRVVPYRGRRITEHCDAWVYRNLMLTDGPWYSIMQHQVVIAHAREVALRDVRFVVREAGRLRVLESGRKNVHAFVVGRIVARRPAWEEAGEGVSGRYNPRRGPLFEEAEPDNGCWRAISAAQFAYLGPSGLTVYGTELA